AQRFRATAQPVVSYFDIRKTKSSGLFHQLAQAIIHQFEFVADRTTRNGESTNWPEESARGIHYSAKGKPAYVRAVAEYCAVCFRISGLILNSRPWGQLKWVASVLSIYKQNDSPFERGT